MLLSNNAQDFLQKSKRDHLKLVEEASDQFTLWFRNESIYMQQWQGLTTMIVSQDYHRKDQLLSL